MKKHIFVFLTLLSTLLLSFSASAQSLAPATGEQPISIVPFILGGIGLLAVIGIAVLMVLEQKKKKETPPPPPTPKDDQNDSL